jgi:hypothetical protein
MRQAPDPERMSYLENPILSRMPTKAECIELNPGPLLFVPRGRLAQSPEWRETAHPTDSATFEELLTRLKSDLPHWNAMDILSVTEPQGD